MINHSPYHSTHLPLVPYIGSMNWVGIGSANGLFGAKPFPESMLTYCQLDPKERPNVKFESKFKTFHS